jgi:hypothetical protein
MSGHRKTQGETEVLPPEKSAGLKVRVDAAHLKTLAMVARNEAADRLMPKVLKGLTRDASYGMMESQVAFPNIESWRACPALEEIGERLVKLGFIVSSEIHGKDTMYEGPALRVNWRGGVV